MKYTWIVVAALVAACGTDEKGTVKKASPPPEAAPEASKPGSGGAPKGDAKILTARALPDDNAEGTGPFEVTLRLEADHRISGELRLPENPLALSGFEQDGTLRIWAAGEPGQKTVHRGFLLGTLDGAHAEGSFAVSGSGGEPSLKGTWSN